MNFWSRLPEFLEGDNQRLSMTRLLCFLSFFPASYVVIVNAKEMNISEILGIYLTAYVLGYIGGKTADAFSKSRRGSRQRSGDEDSDNPAEGG